MGLKLRLKKKEDKALEKRKQAVKIIDYIKSLNFIQEKRLILKMFSIYDINFRITKQDSDIFVITHDFNLERINLQFKEDVLEKYYFG